MGQIIQPQDFASSDFHFAHHNVIKYDKAPFEDVWKKDAAIVERYNELVGPNDNFYFLGDLSVTKDKDSYVAGLLASLNGNKFFIKGNHDHKDNVKIYERYGTYLGEQKRIKIDDFDIILNHFPMRTWNKSHHGSLHFYGHHHGAIEKYPWGRSKDIGIMTNNYYVYNIRTQLIPELLKREKFIVPGDHHSSQR